MSRCFPFPPPGYQSQLRSDQADSLEKEKHKEREHKKEKKDKEKREGKERKDRERNKDKHKVKKDRKEKHKNKDKKKNKDGHKDSNGTSEGRKNEEQIESRHEVKIGESSQRAEEVKDSKFTEELDRRIRDEEKGATNSMLGSFRRIEGMGAATAMGMRRTTGTEMVGISQRKVDGMDRTIGNSTGSIERSEDTPTAMAKNKGSSNHMVANLVSSQKVKNHAMGCAVDNLVGEMQEMPGAMCASTSEKERSADKVKATGMEVQNCIDKEQKKNHRIGGPQLNVVPRRVEGICTATSVEKRSKEQTMVPQPISTAPGRNDGLGRPLENLISSCRTATEKDKGKANHIVANHISSEYANNILHRSMEKDVVNNVQANEKTRHTEVGDWNGGRHDSRDGNEKKRKREDKDRHKEKEKEKEKEEKEKMKEKDEQKHKKEKDKLKESGKKDLVVTSSIKPSTLHKENANTGVTDDKRKTFKVNGFLHEKEERPNKLLKTSSFSSPNLENGRTLMPHTAKPSVLNGATECIMAIGVDKEHKTNGGTGPRPLSVDLKPPHTSKKKVLLKPPHPDSKYLDRIYTVPKMEELPEFDGQEWLFSSDHPLPKPNKKSSAEEKPQVWAEAMQICAADFMALPYVIPY